MRDVFDGATVAFECLGDFRNPQARFLDAITDQGRVKLSPNTGLPFTGTHWRCVGLESPEAFTLVSAGHVHGFRYLDGRTQDGFVQTVGDGLPPFSGTRWRIKEISPGVVTIQSLGGFHNPQHQFLDGITQNGTLGLAPSTNQPFSGTKWRTTALPSPSVDVQTQRNQLGADLTITGSGFTPNDDIRFSAEAIVGNGGERHAPLALGSATSDGAGSINGFARIRFVATQPRNQGVTIRATDHHGRTAHGFTLGFAP